MRNDDFESRQRAREYFHELTVLPGAWAVIRVDGRGFSKLTERNFEKPFDPNFSELMVHTSQRLFEELGARYVYTESDEISVLLAPDHDMFGRGVEKLVSISAGIASAEFTIAAGQAAVFDSRIWVGAGVGDVVDYFAWRQSDATRCALNGWCYWTLRKEGQSKRQATKALEHATTSEKNELLFARGVNFNELPSWQRRGLGFWQETFERKGFDPIRQVEVMAQRTRIRIERELPAKDEYRALIERLAST